MSSEAAPSHNDRVRRLLLDMLSYYSPSGKEKQVTEFCAAELEQAGIPFRRQRVSRNRHNLVVPFGDGPPELLLLGHVDTVPAYELSGIGPTCSEDGTRVFGLGAADMKAGCAAMLEAVIRSAEAGGAAVPGVLALVVGEEEEGDGTRALLRTVRPPRAVVGEPTSLRPCLEHFGYLEVNLRTEGHRRHASYASPNRNSVHAMLRLLTSLTTFLAEEGVVCNVRDMHSAAAGFAVPARCMASMDVHTPVGRHPAELAEKIRRVVGDALPPEDRVDDMPEFGLVHAGYRIDPADPLAGRLRHVFERLGIPWTPAAFPSHSDANLLHAAGITAVVLGPGDLATAHSVEECVGFDQLHRAAEIYTCLLRTPEPAASSP